MVVTILCKILLLVLCISLPQSIVADINLNFFQNDYKIVFERAQIEYYSKEYFNYVNVSTFKYNRTCTAFNASVNAKMDLTHNTIQVLVQTYKFASNEYRLFPARFQSSFCSALDDDIVGIRSFKGYRNFKECPLKKETNYYIYNFTPNSSKLPPHLPNGRYKATLQGFHTTTKIFDGYIYAEVSRPILASK